MKPTIVQKWGRAGRVRVWSLRTIVGKEQGGDVVGTESDAVVSVGRCMSVR